MGAPVAWHAAHGRALRGLRGPLLWRQAPMLPSAVALMDADGRIYALLGGICHVQPLDASRFLAWHPATRTAGDPWVASGLRLALMDAARMAPIEEPATAARGLMAGTSWACLPAGEVTSTVLPTHLGAGRHVHGFEHAIHGAGEILALVTGTSYSVTPSLLAGRVQELWSIRPREGWFESFPQDWLNLRPGPACITRVAREPATGAVVGEGTGIEPFRLDSTSRRVAAWLAQSPFSP